MNASVILVSDLMFALNNIDSFNTAKGKGLKDTNYLTWTAIRCSVPKYLKNLNVDRNVLRAAIRNFHLGPCKIEKSKIAKLCHNKGLPKPFIKI